MNPAEAEPFSHWGLKKLGCEEETIIRLRVGDNSIGRHPSPDLIYINSSLVSRHHAEIAIAATKLQDVEIKDLNSNNGTFVNNSILTSATIILKENDIIGFGTEYNEDNIGELPIYRLINLSKNQISNVEEIQIISDDEEIVDVKPILPELPVETKTANQILSIFGNADDVILNNLKRINPLVCEVVKNAANAELIILDSDEAEEEEQDAIAHNPSPNAGTIQTDMDNQEILTISGKSNMEDAEEEQMFSHILLDEMKSEMVEQTSDSEDNCLDIDLEIDVNTNPLDIPIISLIDDDDSCNSNDELDEVLEVLERGSCSQLLFSSPNNTPPVELLTERSENLSKSDEKDCRKAFQKETNVIELKKSKRSSDDSEKKSSNSQYGLPIVIDAPFIRNKNSINQRSFLSKKKSNNTEPLPSSSPSTSSSRPIISDISCSLAFVNNSPSKDKYLEECKKIRENAEKSRMRNAPKKIRFSDIEKDHEKNSPYKMNSTSSAISTEATSTPLSINCLSKTYRQRRAKIRQDFPTIDKTDDIITLMLSSSNECLHGFSTINLDSLKPMPEIFESFEHYKTIISPLMKLEFLSTMDREYRINKKSKQIFQVTLENVIHNKKRLLLTTTSSTGQSYSSCKCDLVLLKIGEQETCTFAYMTNGRKSEQSDEKVNGMKIFLEILPNSIDEIYLKNSKIIIIQPAIENTQLIIGAYNAIYQLEMTPLNKLLLKPNLLLNQSISVTDFQNQDIIQEASSIKLNSGQTKAIHNIFAKACLNMTETTPNISLVNGPPGTGKSIVVVNLAFHVIYNMSGKFKDKKILICAQSNCTIDSVAFKILEALWSIKDKKQRFQIIRFGIFEKMHRNVHPIALKSVIDFEKLKKVNCTLNKNFENANLFKKHLEKLKNELNVLKEQTSPNIDILNKIKTIQKEYDTLRLTFNNALSVEEEHYVCRRYLEKTNVVCTTLSSCVKLFQYVDYFDICIIDEATLCTEPWTLLPLKFGVSSLVLVGDSKQLPPTVISKLAANYGLSRSLFTRIEKSINDNFNNKNDASNNNVIYSLRVQYRMHPEICKFPNAIFYKNALINAENTFQHITSIAPYSVLNLEYEQNHPITIQWNITNNFEANFIVELLKGLNEFIPISYNTYGVITPNAELQKFLIDAIIAAKLPHVTVSTIDYYQGQEKDVIIISNACTNGVGFFHRLNVAITRSKKCLIFCGNFRNLHSVSIWRRLLKNAQQRNLYHDIHPQDINYIKTKVIERIKLKKL